MKEVILAATVVAALTSCSLQKRTTNTAKTLGIYGAGVIQKPVLTNLKVNPQKFSSSYASNETQGLEYHKSQAVAKAMMENKADVIIEPAYEITSSGSSVSIILTGYAGSYENFRQLTGADTSLLVDAGIMNYNSGPGATPAAQAVKKKSKTGLLILTLILAGGAIAASGL
ncbi:MAG: hypothetical protein JWQ27_2422 [Ferruginibacter sp.]|nr:hypothetical protein [Ferruginibacter sp.]